MSVTRQLDVALGQRGYPIWIGAGVLRDAARWRTAIRGRHVLVVSNTTVAPLYLDTVLAGLDGLNSAHLLLPDGEQHKSLARCGEVLDALVAAGATDLGGPDWSIADDTAARAQARRQALETARAQALEYAKASGYSDVRVLEISESVGSQPPMPMMRAVRAEAADFSTPTQPGMVEAGVTVRVTYEMAR